MTLPPPVSTGSVLLLLVGSGELESSLGPASFQHETTALGRHARTETELAIAANLAGLVGAFHVQDSLAYGRRLRFAVAKRRRSVQRKIGRV